MKGFFHTLPTRFLRCKMDFQISSHLKASLKPIYLLINHIQLSFHHFLLPLEPNNMQFLFLVFTSGLFLNSTCLKVQSLLFYICTTMYLQFFLIGHSLVLYLCAQFCSLQDKLSLLLFIKPLLRPIKVKYTSNSFNLFLAYI